MRNNCLQVYFRVGIRHLILSSNKNVTLPVPAGLGVYGGGGGTPGAMTLANGTRPALLKAPKIKE